MGRAVLFASGDPIHQRSSVLPANGLTVEGSSHWNDTTTVKADGRAEEGWDSPISRRRLALVIIVVVLIVIAVVAIIITQIEYDNGPALELACELPTDCPFMAVPTASNVSVRNASEAWAYAVHFFPEFSNHTLPDDPDPPWFIGEVENIMIQVEPDGSFFFLGSSDSVPDTPAPPFDQARYRGLEFIELHGGLGNYSLRRCFNMTSEDEHGTMIIGRTFEYRTTFDGLTIFGDDGIKVLVFGNDVKLVRGVHDFDEPGEPHQVIPAYIAWENLFAEERDNYCLRGTRIIRVELCYYLEQNADESLTMYPTWRFVSDDIDFFIDAFTGERVGPIWI